MGTSRKDRGKFQRKEEDHVERLCRERNCSLEELFCSAYRNAFELRTPLTKTDMEKISAAVARYRRSSNPRSGNRRRKVKIIWWIPRLEESLVVFSTGGSEKSVVIRPPLTMKAA